jgi:hypothetical protein
MDFRKLVFPAMVSLTLVGCRHDPYMDAYFEMLNAEKRVLEDRLYELQYDYEQALRELEACHTRKSGDTRQDDNRDTEMQVPPSEEPDAPLIELPPGFGGSTDVPATETSRVFSAGNAGASRGAADDERSTASSQQDREREDAVSAGSPDSTSADLAVTAIRLNARRTGGMDVDGRPGDDALSLLIEPRNAQGQFVAKPGDVSIVLLDPLKRGEDARFARWDFDRETAGRMLTAGGLDRGLHIRVPWPDLPPNVERLHLFVRYKDEDGRAIEADREIMIRPADLVADRWTPRSESQTSRTVHRSQPAARPRAEAEIDLNVVPADHRMPILAEPSNASRDGPEDARSFDAERLDFWSPAR